MEHRVRRRVIRTINRLFSASVRDISETRSEDDATTDEDYSYESSESDSSDSEEHHGMSEADSERAISVSKYDGEPFDCPITLACIEPGDTVGRLRACSHAFDPHAIKKWVRERSSRCPVCRRETKREDEEVVDADELAAIEATIRAAEEHLRDPTALGAVSDD